MKHRKMLLIIIPVCLFLGQVCLFWGCGGAEVKTGPASSERVKENVVHQFREAIGETDTPPPVAVDGEDLAERGKNLVRDLWQAIGKKDMATLDKMMAPGFQSVHPFGAKNRAQQLELLKKLDPGEYTITELQVTYSAGVIVATYKISVEETLNGQRMSKEPAPRLSVFAFDPKAGWQWIAHANLKPLDQIAVDPATLAVADVAIGPLPARVLEFPEDRSCGSLSTRKWDAHHSSPWNPLGEARGKIAIPEGMNVKIEVGERISKDLAYLDSFTPYALKSLIILGNNLNDECLPSIAHLTGLKELAISSAYVSDQGLANLRPLRKLVDLKLDSCKITNRGAEILTDLPNLETLSITNTRSFTNDALNYLNRLTSLRTLNILFTGISEEAPEMLKLELPNLKIICMNFSGGELVPEVSE